MDGAPSSSNKLKGFQNILALSAVTLIVTVWATVSFLAYQNNLLENYTKKYSSATSMSESDLNREDVANWKTYKNEKYGYEFKYPAQFAFDRAEGSADFYGGSAKVLSDQGITFIVASVNYQGSTHEQAVAWIQGIVSKESGFPNCDLLISCNKDAFTITDVTLPNNTKATLATGPYFDNRVFDNYFIQDELSFLFYYENRQEWEGVRDQILSTFKFTGKNNDFLEWKTYVNQKFGYSMQYPSNWEVVEAHPRVGLRPEGTGNILLEDELQKVTLAESDPGFWQAAFQVVVSKNSNNYDTQSWAENYFVPLLTDPSTNLAKPAGEVNIDKLVAKMFSVFAFDSSTTVIGLVSNNLIYTLSYTGDTSNDPDILKHNKIYDQILSTFKFTN